MKHPFSFWLLATMIIKNWLLSPVDVEGRERLISPSCHIALCGREWTFARGGQQPDGQLGASESAWRARPYTADNSRPRICGRIGVAEAADSDCHCILEQGTFCRSRSVRVCHYDV